MRVQPQSRISRNVFSQCMQDQISRNVAPG